MESDHLIVWECTYCGFEHRFYARVDLSQRFRDSLICDRCGWQAITSYAAS